MINFGHETEELEFKKNKQKCLTNKCLYVIINLTHYEFKERVEKQCGIAEE